MALDSRIVIHANAKVIEMIEKAKFLSDRLLDQLPGIFAVVRENGDILRSNNLLAALLRVPEDQARHHNLAELLPADAAMQLHGMLQDVAAGNKQLVQLELPLVGNGPIYRFSISAYGEALGTPLITVLGTDVTELRKRPASV